MLFDTFYGLIFDEVLSRSTKQRENRMVAHLLVLRDSFQIKQHYKASTSRSCCSWVEQQGSE